MTDIGLTAIIGVLVPFRSRATNLAMKTFTLGVLIAGSMSLPGPANLAVQPAFAATATLTGQGTMNHTLGSYNPGVGPSAAFSSPAFGDITGDSTPEIVVANMDGVVEAFRATDRTKLWSRSLGRTGIQASPTLADMNGDAKPDVIVGTMDGRVVWLNGPTGQVVRTFHQGSPQHCPAGQDCRPDGFFASPTVADINGDSKPDIIAPSYDHTIYAWTHTGRVIWRRYLEDTLWSSPVVADIDRDGRPEVVLGGDIWGGNPFGVAQGGLVWVLRRDGSTYPGYPKSIPGQTVWSSPAVADLNRDGNQDIIVGTGNNWPEPNGRRVEAFTAATRRSLSGWPVSVDGQVTSSPAVGDIDNDGALEVTFASNGGWVYAYEANGSRKWRACNSDRQAQCGQIFANGGTVIADVDADGIQEVISSLDRNLRIFDGRNGTVEAAYEMARPATLPASSTPAVAEVNGRTTIIQSSIYRVNGHSGGALAGDVTKVYMFTTGRSLCRADWPQFHRDARRSGHYRSAHDAWTPFDCPADFVRQQYDDFLGRSADTSGTTYWTSRLHNATSGATVIRSFMGSSEFGRVVSPVVRSYLAIHGTYPPTRSLVDQGVAAYRDGTTVAALADSYAQANSIGSLTNAQFVSKVFNNVYKRIPSSQEVAVEVAKLESGTTRGSLASGYAESTLGQSRLETEVNVAMSYLGMLGRSPDSGGWAFWVPKARATSTDALVTGFQRSSEYANRVR